MNKTYHFLGGLPRSGSTVLSAILNQREDTYVTPTSPMLDILIGNVSHWHASQAVIAKPNSAQLDNITRALIDGCWQHIDKPVVIDKARGWAANLPSANIIFQQPMKMVACVRDIPSIMASWLTLLRINPDNYMDGYLASKGVPVTDETRMMTMWHEMVVNCVQGMNKAMVEAPDQVCLVEYDDLVNFPVATMEGIEIFLGLTQHKYDFKNIVSTTNDDDLAAWGLAGMHTIRGSLKQTSKHPKEVLGDELYERFNFSWRNPA